MNNGYATGNKPPYTQALENRFLFLGSLKGLLGTNFVEQNGKRGGFMTGNADGFRTLANYSKLPVNRIRYFPEADETIIGGIERGILFLMAFWSGHSIKAFASITEEVLRSDTSHVLQLVVADLDGSPVFCEMPEFRGQIQGAGETAWVRNGSIVATSGLGLNTDCFAPNTIMLLELP